MIHSFLTTFFLALGHHGVRIAIGIRSGVGEGWQIFVVREDGSERRHRNLIAQGFLVHVSPIAASMASRSVLFDALEIPQKMQSFN